MRLFMNKIRGLLRHRSDAHPDLSKLGNPRAEAIATAIQKPHVFDNDGAVWFAEIESLRNQMLMEESPLGSWDRPWLKRSTELRARLGNVEGEHGNFSTSMPVSTACKASKNPNECKFLYRLTRAAKPLKVVELGTNVGISGCYIGAALKDNQHGRLITLEGSAPKAELAGQNFLHLGLNNYEIIQGDFFDTLQPLVEREPGIDLAFIDGFHEGEATIEFHKTFLSKLQNEAIFVYDDINWSHGMKSAWQTIRNQPGILISVEYGGMGVCVVSPNT